MKDVSFFFFFEKLTFICKMSLIKLHISNDFRTCKKNANKQFLKQITPNNPSLTFKLLKSSLRRLKQKRYKN
jgi:hypothetical protein